MQRKSSKSRILLCAQQKQDTTGECQMLWKNSKRRIFQGTSHMQCKNSNRRISHGTTTCNVKPVKTGFCNMQDTCNVKTDGLKITQDESHVQLKNSYSRNLQCTRHISDTYQKVSAR